ncbi:MAG: hypothetical protein HYV07_00930 [Deltaproteobacteria bacterium]|nr:hypothetical protein [Deltaproteobacteria bacterium]
MREPLFEGARLVARRLREAGKEAYFAGGCVRDMLRGVPPKDYDIATDATPKEVQRLFKRTLAVGAQFGVVLVRLPGSLEYEVATYRADGPYADGRRPTEVSYSTKKEEDVARRDFTINALLMDPETREVIDVVGGRDDLANKLVRAVGEPERRFAEDRLRMLRAVRFAASLGFDIEPATLAGIRSHADAIDVVSKERVVAELLSMWNGPDPKRSIELLLDTGLFGPLFPSSIAKPAELLEWFGRLKDALQGLAPSSVPVIGFSLILDGLDRIDAVLRDLKLPREVIRGVSQVSSIRNRLLSHEGSLPDRLRVVIGEGWPRDRGYLFARGGLESVEPWDALRRELDARPLPELPIVTGQDLIDLGLQPSPRFKDLLSEVETAALERRVSNREEALALLLSLVSSIRET